MKKKMEDVAREIEKELEELNTFVKQKFVEIVEGMGKTLPKLPKTHTKVVWFLKQKSFVKTLERKDIETEYGSPIERHPQNVPDSHVAATTLIRKDQENKEKIIVHILLNCARIRTDAAKHRTDLKECVTRKLIHETIHKLELLTDIFILKSAFEDEDGFTIPIYKAWCERKK